MATVGSVYAVVPVVRTPGDVLASKSSTPPVPAPKAKAKWVTASVADSAAQVIAAVFAEADRRDLHHQRRWGTFPMRADGRPLIAKGGSTAAIAVASVLRLCPVRAGSCLFDPDPALSRRFQHSAGPCQHGPAEGPGPLPTWIVPPHDLIKSTTDPRRNGSRAPSSG